MAEQTFAITIKHEGEDWWLAKVTKAKAPLKHTIYSWSSLREDALTNFETLAQAEDIATKCGGKAITAEACPRCHGLMSKRPALSREDNQTQICQRCGIREALEDFENHEPTRQIRKSAL